MTPICAIRIQGQADLYGHLVEAEGADGFSITDESQFSEVKTHFGTVSRMLTQRRMKITWRQGRIENHVRMFGARDGVFEILKHDAEPLFDCPNFEPA